VTIKYAVAAALCLTAKVSYLQEVFILVLLFQGAKPNMFHTRSLRRRGMAQAALKHRLAFEVKDTYPDLHVYVNDHLRQGVLQQGVAMV
jgi:hypothetical protein